jgi:hypothetical protein
MERRTSEMNTGEKPMEFVIPVGLLLAWIVLQIWVLPRLGIKT